MRTVRLCLFAMLLIPFSAVSQPENSKSQPVADKPSADMASSQTDRPATVSVEIVKMPSSPEPPTTASLDALKSGKLIAHGISIGAGYSFHIPIKSWTQYKAQDVNSSVMPYLVFYPGMFSAKWLAGFLWGSGPETRAYCAATWNLLSDEEAQEIADKLATARAQKAAGGKTLTPEEIQKATGWKPGGGAAFCGFRRIGIYLGKPGGINPTIRPNAGLSDATPSASSVFSTGLAWSPNIGVSLVGGMSLWRFPADPPSSTGTASALLSENRSFWTVTLAVGGNTDIVSALFK
jgi:hypothetical protein